MNHSYTLFLDNNPYALEAEKYAKVTANLNADILIHGTTYRFLKEEITVTPNETRHRLYLTSTPRRQIRIATQPKGD